MELALLSNDNLISDCGHVDHFILLPPSLETLNTKFPHITANKQLDRSKYRCKLCDLLVTTPHMTETELTFRTHEILVEEVHRQIDLLLHQIENVDVPQRNTKAGILRRKGVETTKAMNVAVIEAWLQFWGIWGYEEIGADEIEEMNESPEPDLVGTAELQLDTAQKAKRKFEQELSDDREPKKVKHEIVEIEGKDEYEIGYQFEDEIDW